MISHVHVGFIGGPLDGLTRSFHTNATLYIPEWWNCDAGTYRLRVRPVEHGVYEYKWFEGESP